MPAMRRRLYIVTWLMEAANFMFIFTVQRALADRGAADAMLGLLGGALAGAAILTTMMSGHLSDRFGRKRMIVAAMALIFTGIGTALAGFERDAALIASYVVAGAGMGALYPPIAAWLTHGRGGGGPGSATNRILIAFCVAWNVGLITGQLGGGAVYEWVSPAAAMTLAMAMVVAAFACLMTLAPPADHDPAEAVDEHPDDAHHRMTRSTAFVRLCWIANVAGTFSVSTIVFLFPTLAVEVGIPPDKHGLLLAISRATIIVTYFAMFASRFWHYRFGYSVLAHALGATGLVTIALSGHVLVMAAGLIAFSILPGFNYFASLYYSSTGSRDESRGFAMGLHEGTLLLGMAGGALLGGLVGTAYGARAPYILATAAVALAVLAQAAMHQRLLRVTRDAAAPGAPDCDPCSPR